MSCPVTLQFSSSYDAIPFASSRPLHRLHDITHVFQFGSSTTSTDLQQFIQDTQSHDELRKDYILSLFGFAMVIFGIFLVWILLWTFCWWRGYDKVGFWSGQPLRVVRPQPFVPSQSTKRNANVHDDDDDDGEDGEDDDYNNNNNNNNNNNPKEPVLSTTSPIQQILDQRQLDDQEALPAMSHASCDDSDEGDDEYLQDTDGDDKQKSPQRKKHLFMDDDEDQDNNDSSNGNGLSPASKETSSKYSMYRSYLQKGVTDRSTLSDDGEMIVKSMQGPFDIDYSNVLLDMDASQSSSSSINVMMNSSSTSTAIDELQELHKSIQDRTSKLLESVKQQLGDGEGPESNTTSTTSSLDEHHFNISDDDDDSDGPFLVHEPTPVSAAPSFTYDPSISILSTQRKNQQHQGSNDSQSSSYNSPQVEQRSGNNNDNNNNSSHQLERMGRNPVPETNIFDTLDQMFGEEEKNNPTTDQSMQDTNQSNHRPLDETLLDKTLEHLLGEDDDFLDPTFNTSLQRSQFTSQALQRKRQIEQQFAQDRRKQESLVSSSYNPTARTITTNLNLTSTPNNQQKVQPPPWPQQQEALQPVLQFNPHNHSNNNLELWAPQAQDEDSDHGTYPKEKRKEDEEDETLPSVTKTHKSVSFRIDPPQRDQNKNVELANNKSWKDMQESNWEYEKAMAEYATKRNGLERQLTRMRYIIFFCVSVIVAACVLFTVMGVDSLTRAVQLADTNVQQVQDISLQAINLINQEQQQLEGAQIATSALLQRLNTQFCPLKTHRLCDNITATEPICNISDIPLAVDVKDWIGFFGGNKSESVLFPPLPDYRGDMQYLIQEMEHQQETLHSFDWAFYVASACAIALASSCLFLLWSVLLISRRGTISKRFECIQSKVFLPLFFFLTILSWISNMVFVIGSTVVADFCYESPDASVTALLDQLSPEFSTETIHEFLYYTVEGCPVQQLVTTFSDRVNLLATLIAPMARFSTALDQVDATESAFANTCGSNIAPFQVLAFDLSNRLCELTKTVSYIRDLFRCEIWFPIYERLVYSAICYDGSEGFLWAM